MFLRVVCGVGVGALLAVCVASRHDADAGAVSTVDADRIARLKAVLWDMTTITHRIEVIHHPGSGDDDGWTERNLYITITAKTAEEMKTVYHFNRNQIAALDELLEQLRGQGYVSVDEVRWAVLENSGQLSILPWARQRPPTAEELGLTPEEAELPFILINDGRIVRRNLARSGRNEAWLQKELRRTGHSAGEIFLLTVDGSGKVLCIPKEAKP